MGRHVDQGTAGGEPGTGYPDGLAGTAIPRGSRIIAVCDAYEAMTADRPYRRARSSEAACHELRASAGTQFDPEVVDVFVLEISGRGTADAETTNETEWPVQALAARVRTLLSQPEALLSERRLG